MRSDLFGAATRTLVVSATAYLLCLAGSSAALQIDLVPFASGLASPVAIAHPPGENRLFVAEQVGRIRIVEADGTVLATPFLDIDPSVLSGGERGLLGIAFHPDHANNDYFYVNYTNNGGDTVISRFTRIGANTADPLSEFILLTVAQPFGNHNAGDIAFGPNDGYLYIPLGDGGSGCDPNNVGQDPAQLLGNMLRVDVDAGSPYAIPASNPFVGDPLVPDEVWAYGFRNPWRFSFDPDTGDMFIADVGQNQWEEINFQPATSAGGENYGWDCFEGTHPASDPPSNCSVSPACPPASHTPPVHEYSHASGIAVVGGHVYRGTQQPLLEGHYFFTDLLSGTMWSLTPDGGGGFDLNTFTATVPGSATTFGVNDDGELFVATLGGAIFHIEQVTPPAACPASPTSGCLSTARAALTMKDKEADGAGEKDKLVAKWLKGPATTQANFGNPVTTTGYSFCLYAGTASALVATASVPAAGTCSGKPCWKAISTKGYRFKDKTAANDGGTFQMKLSAGEAGKSKILFKAKGPNLDLTPATLPLDESAPLTVQFIGTDSAECWEMTFPPASVRRNDDEQFKAKTY
jgi:glucose/arabinose dehydrogenase